MASGASLIACTYSPSVKSNKYPPLIKWTISDLLICSQYPEKETQKKKPLYLSLLSYISHHHLNF